MPLWWNWQTRGTQNPVVAIPCRFDPDQRHQIKREQGLPCSLFICVRCGEGEHVRQFATRQIFAVGSRLRDTAIYENINGIVLTFPNFPKLFICKKKEFPQVTINLAGKRNYFLSLVLLYPFVDDKSTKTSRKSQIIQYIYRVRF